MGENHFFSKIRMTAALWMAVCLANGCAVRPAAVQPNTAVLQRHFETPADAVKALTAAAKAQDQEALKGIFGTQADDIISSGDPARDKEMLRRFVLAAVQTKITPVGKDRAVLFLGEKQWPFPVPLLKEQAGWRFDTAAGREEIMERRIGENEIGTIAALRALVRAQKEYALADRNGDRIPEYAQKLASTPGRRDGLYWKTEGGKPASLIGPLLAGASPGGTPFHGYYFKILTAQGPSAHGGAQDYMVNGRLMLGFGAAAFPAKYGSSGLMTFIVNQRGTVYQKDLGTDSAKLAEQLTAYDPGPGWQETPE